MSVADYIETHLSKQDKTKKFRTDHNNASAIGNDGCHNTSAIGNLTRVKANPGVTDKESKENYVYSSKPYSYCVYGCQECDFKGRYMNRNLFCF